MTLTFTRPRDLKLDEPGYATGSAGSWDKPHVGYYDLPYGLWLSDNGREVLFNRHYRALWWRMPDGPAVRVKVKHFTALFPDESYRESWFIESDNHAPHLKAAYWQRSEKILLAFLTGRPVSQYLLDSPPRR